MARPAYDPELFPHWTETPVRFRDLDPLNHVNNAIFSTYLEEGRINFIQRVPGFAGQIENGFSFVLANINIEFIKPVAYPETLLTGSGIKSLGNSSVTSFQAIYTKGSKELVSSAEASAVWFNLKKQRPARIPEVEEVERFMVEV